MYNLMYLIPGRMSSFFKYWYKKCIDVINLKVKENNMQFVCFNGEHFTTDNTGIDIIDNQFIYIKDTDTLINYKTVSHDYDFSLPQESETIYAYL